jgi:hypothetical protein
VVVEALKNRCVGKDFLNQKGEEEESKDIFRYISISI